MASLAGGWAPFWIPVDATCRACGQEVTKVRAGFDVKSETGAVHDDVVDVNLTFKATTWTMAPCGHVFDPDWNLLDDAEAPMERHRSFDFPFDPDDGPGDYAWTPRCERCGEAWPCARLRDAVAGYESLPGYKPEWRPDA